MCWVWNGAAAALTAAPIFKQPQGETMTPEHEELRELLDTYQQRQKFSMIYDIVIISLAIVMLIAYAVIVYSTNGNK